MTKFTLAVVMSLLSCSMGCLSTQLARDGINVRQAILDMYTDQVMDNLIRARSNMPFVQLRYSSIQVNDAQDLSSGGTIDEMVNAATAVTGAVSRAFNQDYKVTPSIDRKRIMNFTCDPVTDQNDIYLKYMAFANSPNLFVVSEKQPDFPVHIVRKCHGQYYWVPVEAGPAFLDLAMQTTFQRGKNDNVLTAAVAVTIADVEKVTETLPQPDRDVLINATLLFDKPLPNGPATIVVDLADGRKMRLNVWPVQKMNGGKPPVDLGQPTTRFDVQWDRDTMKLTPDDLQHRPARFYSHDFPPETQGPSLIEQQVNANVNQIKTQLQLQTLGK